MSKSRMMKRQKEVGSISNMIGSIVDSNGFQMLAGVASGATIATFAMDLNIRSQDASIGTLTIDKATIGMLEIIDVSPAQGTASSEGDVTAQQESLFGPSTASAHEASPGEVVPPAPPPEDSSIIQNAIEGLLVLGTTLLGVAARLLPLAFGIRKLGIMFGFFGAAADTSTNVASEGLATTGQASVEAGDKSKKSWLSTNKVMLGIIATIGFMIVAWDNLGVIGQIVCTALVIGLTLVKLASLGVTWPLLLIIGIVMAVAAVFLFWSDLAIKVCGLIMGGIFAVGAVIFNVFAIATNIVIKFCEIAYNIVAWLVWAYITMWYKFLVAFEGIMMAVAKIAETVGNTILKVMQAIANAIIGVVNVAINALNLIPGVDINTMSKVTFEPMDTVSNMEAFYASLESPGEFQYKDFDNVEKKSISDAFQKGQGIGESIGSSIVSWLEGIGRSDSGSAGSTVPPGMTPPEMQTPPTGSMGGDLGMQTPPPGSGMSSGSMPTVPVNAAGGTIDEVGSIGSPVEMAEEDIKYMKDIAQTEYINQFTTLQPKLNATFGDIKETADVEKLMASIEQMMAEAYARSYVT